MPNHLSEENSPYLLQHSNNPVDWYPWGSEALEKARSEDKPIFLSIGYAACHWCHVMAHESFEDPATAAIMNEHFVNIKVDREERPDLDSIYMNAVVAMTGQGGWPMSLFLTPGGQPFFGGTYFPPVRRYQMPAFIEVLQFIAAQWQSDRTRLLQASRSLLDHLEQAQSIGQTSQPLSHQALDEAALHLAQSYDWQKGGWGKAPKFPQPMAIEFLLRRARRSDRMALDIASHALEKMARGGMYDLVGGGFARYSTDDEWLVPHFEKMLYDNAQLASAYLHAYLLTGRQEFRTVCERTLDFMQRDLMAPSSDDRTGGFFSSLDADSEGEEGKYYLWTAKELEALLSHPLQENPEVTQAEFFFAAHAIQPQGNFEGKIIFQRVLDDETLAIRFNLPTEQVISALSRLYEMLLAARRQRIPPAADDKVLTSWNALAILAFAEAARYLQRPDYLQIARQNADFLLTELYPGKQLLRSWRNGKAAHRAYLEDHAALILALLALYQSDPHPRWFRSTVQLTEDIFSHYADPDGGFFDTSDDAPPLILRPSDASDNATPSGNGMAALALIQMAAYTGNGAWRSQAETMLSAIQELATRYPTGFAFWLCALDTATHPLGEVAILGDPASADTRELLATLWREYRPETLLAFSAYPPPHDAPPLLQDRPLLNELPTAYVCQGFVCQQPTSSPQVLATQLGQLT